MQESLSEKFHKFSQDDAADELQAACLVAQTLEPKLDFRDLQRRLGVLVDDCDNADEPWLYLQEIGLATKMTMQQWRTAALTWSCRVNVEFR